MNNNISLKPVGSYSQVLINTNTPLIFNNPLFGNLNVYMDNYNNPWFMGKEVAEKLGYKDTRKAIWTHVLEENKMTIRVVSEFQGESPWNPLGGNPNMVFINEYGLYDLVRSSKMRYAKDFKYWTDMITVQLR